MLKFVIIFVILGSIASESTPPDQLSCRENEEFVECRSGCTENCDNYGEPCGIRVRCPNPGCTCLSGYTRDVNGKCIPIDDCVCSKNNEVWSECKPPSKYCEFSCQNDLSLVLCPPTCTKGCVCDKGYIRNGNSCILVEDCKKNQE